LAFEKVRALFPFDYLVFGIAIFNLSPSFPVFRLGDFYLWDYPFKVFPPFFPSPQTSPLYPRGKMGLGDVSNLAYERKVLIFERVKKRERLERL
jgi:hypothetical protein